MSDYYWIFFTAWYLVGLVYGWHVRRWWEWRKSGGINTQPLTNNYPARPAKCDMAVNDCPLHPDGSHFLDQLNRYAWECGVRHIPVRKCLTCKRLERT